MKINLKKVSETALDTTLHGVFDGIFRQNESIKRRIVHYQISKFDFVIRLDIGKDFALAYINEKRVNPAVLEAIQASIKPNDDLASIIANETAEALIKREILACV